LQAQIAATVIQFASVDSEFCYHPNRIEGMGRTDHAHGACWMR